MDRKSSRPGVKGKRNVERINPKLIDETFVSEYPLKKHEEDIIELIYSHRAMHSSDLIKILNCRYCRSPNRIRESLLDLHIARFVERKTIGGEIGKGSREPYYMLDKAGAMFLAFKRNIMPEQIKWRKRDNVISYDNLAHTFGLSKIRVAVEEIAKKTNNELKEYLTDRQINICFNMNDVIEPVQFLPDAYFHLGEFRNFIEFDRDTESLKEIQRKAAVYEAFNVSKQYKEHFGEKFPNVLFIVEEKEGRSKKEKRIEEMIKAVLKVKQNVFFCFCRLSDFLENPLDEKIYTII